MGREADNMKIKEVTEAILRYHPELAHRDRPTCDGYKCGDPGAECTGIVTSCSASMEVIRKTIELGANLILVHEPTFYTHMDPTDWLEGDPVYEEKRTLLDSHGIAVWRDHDHIHTHRPDGIMTGVLTELGWLPYAEGEGFRMLVRLPEPTTVHELALFLKEKMHLEGVRYVGCPDATVQTVGFTGHMPFEQEQQSTKKLMDPEIDVLIPGEVIDWTAVSYARDAGQQGRSKAIMNVGHVSMEELGMKWMVSWLRPLVGDTIPITFVPSADMYHFAV